jgi:hypothetical protein
MAASSLAILAPEKGNFLTRLFRPRQKILPGSEYAVEDGDKHFLNGIGDVYARKPDGRVYDLTE